MGEDRSMNVPSYAAIVLTVVGVILSRREFKGRPAGRSAPLVMAAGMVLLALGSWLSHDTTVWTAIIIVVAIVLAIASIAMWIRERRMRHSAGND
ncbi:putative membrane protein [Rhodococcus sp. LBL1]|nr:putative membrane protein [Rhodococcus sp. LBL1]MDH6686365.1 putative membrane protein [Rhodococcus sp. LBL2]